MYLVPGMLGSVVVVGRTGTRYSLDISNRGRVVSTVPKVVTVYELPVSPSYVGICRLERCPHNKQNVAFTASTRRRLFAFTRRWQRTGPPSHAADS